MSKTVQVTLKHVGEAIDGVSATTGKPWRRRSIKVTTDQGQDLWLTVWGDMVDTVFYQSVTHDGPWTLEYEMQVRKLEPADSSENLKPSGTSEPF